MNKPFSSASAPLPGFHEEAAFFRASRRRLSSDGNFIRREFHDGIAISGGVPSHPRSGAAKSVRGTVIKILYSNIESGFQILRVRLEGTEKVFSFVGPGEAARPGDCVESDGEWEMHARFGRQLRCKFIRRIQPSTAKEIHAFICAGGIKGVGRQSADKLIARHGENLPNVMLDQDALLLAGIKPSQARKIAEDWACRTQNVETLAFLAGLGIGPQTSRKIIERYKNKTRHVIESDPYRMIRDISKMGFKEADRIALATGMDPRDERRIRAAIMHELSKGEDSGNCAQPFFRLTSKVQEAIGAPQRDIEKEISNLEKAREVVIENINESRAVYRNIMHECENEVAQMLAQRAMRKSDFIKFPTETIEKAISDAALDANIACLHEHQREAVARSTTSSVSIITGGPGSGKTSSLIVLMETIRKLHEKAKIKLAAPTGRAAQRMSETTKHEARTIHRLLEWSPEKHGFTRDETNPLDVDFMIVDESSMIDIFLMRSLLRAMPAHASIVFVGDMDQLPSVGPGRVLADMIESGVIPVTRLTKVFRQGEGSSIAMAAKEINAGKLPKMRKPNTSTDMWAVWEDDHPTVADIIVRLASVVAKNLGYDPMKDVQVLSPGHKGETGTVALNESLRAALNPPSPSKAEGRSSNTLFREGDRVIQTVNNYDKDVFNGDIGVIVKINASSSVRDGSRSINSLVVDFDGHHVFYEGSDAGKELNLAYAISVHKSQGSEFPFVILSLTSQHYPALQRSLIYTGITRARKICAIVGSKKAAGIAVNKLASERITSLAGKLRRLYLSPSTQR